jgi:alpha-beta hydrolase superfamily lysophospholipase
MLIEIAALKILKVEPDRPSKDIPLLFVHGMWEGAWLWKGYLDFFSSCGYTCYALNLRGHDGSKPATDIGKVSIHDYIADARTVAEELNNPVLIGHSMGGLLVQKLAELLEPPAIVAIAPAAPRGIFASYKEYDGFAHMIVLEPGWERVAQDIAIWLEKAVQIGGAGGAAHKNGAMGACE